MLEVLRSRPALARARCSSASSATSPPGSAATHAVAVSSGTAGLHLGVRARRRGATGDEVVTSPSQLRRLGQLPALRGRAPVFCDIDPVTLNLDPAAAAAAVTERTAGAAAGAHLRLPGRPAGASRRSPRHGLGSSRTPARRSAPSTPTARRSAAAGNLAVFAFYANKQMTTGEGGMVTTGRRRRSKARIDSERNQGRAPDMGWLDHDRLGFNYRLTDVAAAIGVAQLERLDEMLAARARGRRAATREALGAAIEGLDAALRGPRRRAAQLVRLRRAAAATAPTATT